MRVAIVETASRGGLLHYAAQLADGLAAGGHDVSLVAPRGHELAGHEGRARRRDVLTVAQPSGPVPRSRLGYLARRAAVAARLLACWLRIVREARRGGYDAVVLNCDLHLWLPAAVALLLVSLPGGPKIADVCHNVRPYNRWGGDELFSTSRLLGAILRRLYPRFDVVFVHGPRSRAEFLELWGAPPIAIIPHGDERAFGDEVPQPAAEERILFFGDWRKVKGLGVLMDAFDLLAPRRPAARLTIAGTPSDVDFDPQRVQAWATRHGGAVELRGGYVPNEDVGPLFASARVVVNPYLVGYQSGVVHLAMTMGRAVVCSDVGDLPASVRHEETGLVVPPADPAALAFALERVIADPDLARRLGLAGRRRLDEHHSWEHVGQLVGDKLS